MTTVVTKISMHTVVVTNYSTEYILRMAMNEREQGAPYWSALLEKVSDDLVDLVRFFQH